MENAARSGAITEDGRERPDPSVRDAERAGKAGDNVERHAFVIQPKHAVIEITGGVVAVKVGKAAESA